MPTKTMMQSLRHSYILRLLIIAFALCLWADALNPLNFKWIYPPEINTDGGPREWYGFPFPYSIDAQYTSMARNLMPHVWLLNMTICTSVLAWVLHKFLPSVAFKRLWVCYLSSIGLILIGLYFLLYWSLFDLNFMWNASPYMDYENVSIFDLRPHFGD